MNRRSLLLASLILVLISAISSPAQSLLNLNFGAAERIGPAAASVRPSETNAWNLITAATNVAATYTFTNGTPTVPVITWGALDSLVWADGAASTVTVTLTNLTEASLTGSDDAMLGSLLGALSVLVEDYDTSTNLLTRILSLPTITLSNLPPASYDVYLYGLGPSATNGPSLNNQGFAVQLDNGPLSDWKWTAHPGALSTQWQEGVQFVRFSEVVVTNGQLLTIRLAANSNGAHLVNGLQLVNRDFIAPAPTLSSGSGTYTNAQTVTLSSSLAGASYRYSTNGVDWFSYAQPLTFVVNTTLRAQTVKDGYVDSPVVTVQFVFPDSDGDGLTDAQEYLLGTDPNDYFNGVLPILTMVSGDYQSGAVNMFLSEPLVVRVTSTNGVSLINAPVTFTVTEGAGQVARSAGGALDSALLVRTDGSGSAQVFFKVPPTTNGENHVTACVQTGNDTTNVTFTAETSLDAIPPWLVITSPTNLTTSRPMIQLQGYAVEPLASIAFDMSGASGTVTNQQGFVVHQYYDTNTFQFTTNWFQCYDIDLAVGTNLITLRAKDLAGNVMTTNLTYILDFTGATNAPAVNVYWPPDGAQISGTNFTLRGQLADPTAHVSATVTAPDGTTQQAQALVERNGTFWLEHLPLSAGTNQIVLVATDAAGNVSTSSLSVLQSTVNLTMNPVPSEQLHQPRVTATGTISDPGYTVWVNGVRASQDGGVWLATNVPVNVGGTATFIATAIPNSDNDGNGHWATDPPLTDPPLPSNSPFGIPYQMPPLNPASMMAFHLPWDWDKPMEVYVQNHHTSDKDDNESRSGDEFAVQHHTLNWNRIFNGYIGFDTFESEAFADLDEPYFAEGGTVYFWPGTLGWRTTRTHCGSWSSTWSGWVGAPDNILWEHSTVSKSDVNPDGSVWTYEHNAQTTVKLYTGGKSVAGRQNLFVIAAGATAQTWWGASLGAVPSQQCSVMGKNLGADGLLYIVLPDGAEQDLTVRVRRQRYTFSVDATKHELNIKKNNQIILDDIFAPGSTNCVGEKLTFAWEFSPPVYGITQTNVQWIFTGQLKNKKDHKQVWVEHEFGGFWADDPESSDKYSVDPARFKESETWAWWYSDGMKYVSLFLDVTFSNGQSVKIPSFGKFYVYRPHVVMVDKAMNGAPRLVWITRWNSVNFGHIKLGVSDNGPNDIRYNVRVISDLFGGRGKITQLCTLDFTGLWHDVNIANALDTVDPYSTSADARVYATPTPIGYQNLLELEDAPEAAGLGTIRENGSFTDYIMFKPDGPGNIYVTLGIVEWSVSTTVSSPALPDPPGNVVEPTGPSNSSQFPEWDKTYHSR